MALARNVLVVAGGTLASRVLAFLRDAGIAALLGAGPVADAYIAALQIPNLFRRLLAEGAFNAAFVPLWLRIRDRDGADAARHFGENALGAMALALGATAIGLIVLAPLAVRVIAPGFADDGERFVLASELVRLSAPYIAIAGCVAVFGAVLNAERRVGAVALGPVVFNCVLLIAIAALWFGRHRSSVWVGNVLMLAMVAAGLGQAVLIGSVAARLPTCPRRFNPLPSPAVHRLFLQAGPGLVAAGIPQLTILLGSMIASSSPAAVSWLYYADRLYEFPLGIASVAIATVMGPLIAQRVRDGAVPGIAFAQARAFELALGLALPATIGLVILAEPGVRALFQRGAFTAADTGMVSTALAVIALGLPGHAVEKVLGAISFAHEDTRTPMATALAGLATAGLVAVLLFPWHGPAGVAAGIAAGGYVGAAVLALVLGRRGWLRLDSQATTRVPRLAAAAGAMGLVLIATRSLIAMLAPASAVGQFALLAAAVALGLGVYAGALRLLGIGSAELVAALRRPRPPLAP